MLGELARHSDLPVPAVHMGEPDLLVMDYIDHDGGGITPQVERHAAELIARLHATPRRAFGYERDTLIGPLPQPNPWTDRWIPFFRDERLLAMARAAEAEGRLPASFLGRIERLAARLDELFARARCPEPASRRSMDGKRARARQPDRRLRGSRPSIAATGKSSSRSPRCLGRLGAPSSRPMRRCCRSSPASTRLRSDLYKLYPTLVHVRLFGSAYLAPIDRTLSRLGL